jgi:hypothetical protein
VRLRAARVAGERVLAAATSPDGELAGTRLALHLPDGTRLPWEQVEAAEWDAEARSLHVTLIGAWGQERPSHDVPLDDGADRLLQLVRERVTSTVLLQRRVPVQGRLGAKVIGRRSPAGELAWYVDYDPGLDPADPFVDQAVQEGLAEARAEVGEHP